MCDPAEDRAEPEDLMRLPADELPGPFALVMFQPLAEGEKPIGAREVESIRKRRGRLARPIAEVPRACEPVVLASRHTIREHRVGVQVHAVFISTAR